MGSLGFAFGPLIAAYITQNLGLEKMFVTSAFGIILALFMFKFVPKLSKTEVLPEKKEFLESFKEILTNRQIDYLMIIAMMKSLVTNSSCILLPFLWKSMGYSAFYIGFALFLFVFAGSIGSFLSPYAEKIFGSKPIQIYIPTSCRLCQSSSSAKFRGVWTILIKKLQQTVLLKHKIIRVLPRPWSRK